MGKIGRHIGWHYSLLALVAAMGFVAPALSADQSWVSTKVRGTVIYLAGDRWEEVTRDQDISTASIRTLRSGQLSMEADGFALTLGPSSVIELGASQSAGDAQVRQYVGTMTISSTGASVLPLSIRAGRLSVVGVDGEIAVTVTDTATTFAVLSGTVAVRAPDGVVTSVVVGEYIADQAGAILAAAKAVPPKAAVASIVGGSKSNDASDGASNSNAGGNGVGNGPGSNNAGGNGNGNGPGSNSAGGNGNGNGLGGNSAGGNGNGNGPGGNSAGGNGNGPDDDNGGGDTDGGSQVP